jgi:hypothetical protein
VSRPRVGWGSSARWRALGVRAAIASMVCSVLAAAASQGADRASARWLFLSAVALMVLALVGFLMEDRRARQERAVRAWFAAWSRRSRETLEGSAVPQRDRGWL